MDQSPNHVSIAIVFFCHDGQGRFLMQKRGGKSRDERGRWSPGAGGLEVGETVEETLVREIKEEYGSDALKYEFLGYRDFLGSEENGKRHWIRLDFKALVDPVATKNNEPHKLDDVQWFTWDTLPPKEEMHSEWARYIEKYGAVLREA